MVSGGVLLLMLLRRVRSKGKGEGGEGTQRRLSDARRGGYTEGLQEQKKIYYSYHIREKKTQNRELSQRLLGVKYFEAIFS